MRSEPGLLCRQPSPWGAGGLHHSPLSDPHPATEAPPASSSSTSTETTPYCVRFSAGATDGWSDGSQRQHPRHRLSATHTAVTLFSQAARAPSTPHGSCALPPQIRHSELHRLPRASRAEPHQPFGASGPARFQPLYIQRRRGRPPSPDRGAGLQTTSNLAESEGKGGQRISSSRWFKNGGLVVTYSHPVYTTRGSC